MPVEIIYTQYFKTKFGELLLGSYKDQLCVCDWRYRKLRAEIDKRIVKGLSAEYREEETDIIQKAKEQLTDYFSGNRQKFDIPLRMVGTEFQKKVWNQLLTIPYGKTQTYLELANKIGNEKTIRAVASANGANAISIFVPCHRIIGTDGKLIGYAGGVETKKKLLQLEGSWPGDHQMSLFD